MSHEVGDDGMCNRKTPDFSAHLFVFGKLFCRTCCKSLRKSITPLRQLLEDYVKRSSRHVLLPTLRALRSPLGLLCSLECRCLGLLAQLLLMRLLLVGQLLLCPHRLENR